MNRTGRPGWGALLSLLILLAATSLVGAYRFHHDAAKWTPDTAIYLRMTLADLGRSPEAAKVEADRFMLTTAERANPQSRGFYGEHPPAFYAKQFALFRTRPLLPKLAALLYPRFGPRSLPIVSVCAYVLATVAMFVLLLAIAPAWLAALGAFAFATAPAVLDVAALGMSDELAAFFWICALAGLLSFVRHPSRAALIVIGIASLLMAFTRPAAYLPVGAAIGVGLALRRTEKPRGWTLGVLGVTFGALALFLAYSAAVHGPGPAEQVGWQYAWQVATGDAAGAAPLAWYLRAEATAFAELFTVGIYKNAALLVLALAAFGVALIRPRRLVPPLLGAVVASAVAVIVNPLELQRTVELPLTPVVVILATAALGALAQTPREVRP